jgi:hypothetical protein
MTIIYVYILVYTHRSNLTVVHGESTPSHHVCIGNPAPILDLATGRVWMLFSRNNNQMGLLYSGTIVYVIRSNLA